MLDSKKRLEKFLQQQRFKKVLPLLKGDVLDFGGNEGELGPFVQGTYTLVNYDYAPLNGGSSFDVIVALAVIEHIEVNQVYALFRKFKSILKKEGSILISTPAPMSAPVLELLAAARLLDKKNIEEHKHYWNKQDLLMLASNTGFSIFKYSKFQFGFNQFTIFIHQ